MLNQIFVTFLSDLSSFLIILLLTPLTTTSYLVASSQARSYGILKTTCSDRLTCKNRLGSEVGDSTRNPGVHRSNDHLLCCNNANPMAIVIDLTINFFTHFSKSMQKSQKFWRWFLWRNFTFVIFNHKIATVSKFLQKYIGLTKFVKIQPLRCVQHKEYRLILRISAELFFPFPSLKSLKKSKRPIIT
jgi:hypothetical protein